MGFISHHIIPLVINSLGGGHTHTHIHEHTQTDVHTETILRNQAHAGHTGQRAPVSKIGCFSKNIDFKLGAYQH